MGFVRNKNRCVRNIFFHVFAFVFLFNIAFSMSLVGLWQSVDENTHKPTSIVQIYKSAHNDSYNGKIMYLYPQKNLKRVCYHCPAPYTNQKVVGMTFITGLTLASRNFYDHGTIIDPKTGNEYRLDITQLSSRRIKLRGYIGFPLFGRTQYWNRFHGDLALLQSMKTRGRA